MNRREFLGSSAMLAGYDYSVYSEVVVEKKQAGKPHAGKVLAVIQPHSDDFTIFNGGLVAKLIDEGYQAYLIRVTNDDMAGPGSIGNTVLENEKDNNRLVKLFGFAGNFDLNYPNHNMDNTSPAELKSRFIFLFRLLKVDCVISYSPWGHYEENPDHYITAQCVEAACWISGGDKDYPEHFAAGLKPHGVREKYYYGRFDWKVNRVVDIGPWVERKIDGLVENKAQGPAGEKGSELRARLASQGLKLPLLGNDDTAANRNYIREFVLRRNRELGQKYNLEYAEPYLYIGPEPDIVEEYVKKNAVRL
ncbi:MAG: PIG-L family deacetylase [Acidobacteria bacterium]|nr:PIG-L family deacetylase [Acidobacteriota bacterium]